MRVLFVPLVLVLATLLSSPAAAAHEEAAAPYRQLVGRFVGEVYNGSDLDAVVTAFSLDEYGRVTGSYDVDEESGAYSGILTNIVFEDERSISMEWTDKFGEGFAVLEFSPDFSSFRGEWTGKDGMNPLPWTGAR